ncbi:MAG: hypothetical protein QME42_07500 [bacterium]|nr:hypothetical protein [bacterium]
MMKKLLILSSILIFLPINTFAELTKQDIAEIRMVVKEEIGHVDKRIDDLEKGLNKRIDDLEKGLNKRIDDLDNKLSTRINDLQGLFYVLLAGMFTLVGFILWDRRTTLAPAVKQMEELSQKEKAVDKMLEVLKVYAKKEPRFKEAMQTAGLL